MYLHEDLFMTILHIYLSSALEKKNHEFCVKLVFQFKEYKSIIIL